MYSPEVLPTVPSVTSIMVVVNQLFRPTVWTYTFSNGPQAGKVFFHSPQSSWSDERKSIILRQAKSEHGKKAWLCRTKSLVTRCDGDRGAPTSVDADGVIIQDGFGTALQPTCGSSKGGGGAPLVPYARGERIWVDHSLSPGHGFAIPVISIDTLEFFLIPCKDICLVPQLLGVSDAGDQVFAAPTATTQSSVGLLGPRCCQAYFEWPISQPEATVLKLDTWDLRGGGARRTLSRFRAIDDLDMRHRLFKQLWALHTIKSGSWSSSHPALPSYPSMAPRGDTQQEINPSQDF